MSNIDSVISDLLKVSHSIFERGLTPGSSANISIRNGEQIIITPTGSCLGFLTRDDISFLDASGKHLSGPKPSKELPLHMAIYENQPECHAVIHTHSTWTTAASCVEEFEFEITPLTPYLTMRLGKIGFVRYETPGALKLAEEIRKISSDYRAIVMQNHGPLVAGKNIYDALYNLEELEESAKLMLLCAGKPVRQIPQTDLDELIARYG